MENEGVGSLGMGVVNYSVDEEARFLGLLSFPLDFWSSSSEKQTKKPHFQLSLDAVPVVILLNNNGIFKSFALLSLHGCLLPKDKSIVKSSSIESVQFLLFTWKGSWGDLIATAFFVVCLASARD